MHILGLLLFMIGILVYLTIVVPMKRSVRALRSLVTVKNSLFSICIGLGYLAIEISQMQKINLFLGHPVFALVVVLFTFLTSSGVRSQLLSVKDLSALGRMARLLCVLLILVLVVGGFATSAILESAESYELWTRIFYAVLVMFSAGFLMGFPLAMGMELLRFTGRQDLAPWYWAINGSMSVLATILVTIVTINLGISVSYWFGVTCYAIASYCMLSDISREVRRGEYSGPV